VLHVGEELERGRNEHRPYWKRAHHDWRFWVALVLMLAAMLIYMMTDDLSIVPSIHTRAAPSSRERVSLDSSRCGSPPGREIRRLSLVAEVRSTDIGLLLCEQRNNQRYSN